MNRAEYLVAKNHSRRGYLFNRFVNAVVDVLRAEKEKGKRKSAHDHADQLRVAVAAARYAFERAKDYNVPEERAVYLAATTGIFHDFVRLPREIKGRSDGLITADIVEILGHTAKAPEDAQKFVYYLLENYREKARHISFHFHQMFLPYEIKLIADVIRHNEGTVPEIMDKLEKENNPMKVLIQLSLLYGDKAYDGVGPIVVLRRAQFVSGERFSQGDLVEFGKQLMADYNEDVARVMCYLGESMIRMYAKKKLQDFPNDEMFQHVLSTRDFEEKTHDALLNYIYTMTSINSEMELFNMLKAKGFPKMEQYAEKIKDTIEKRQYHEIDKRWMEDITTFVLALAYLEDSDKSKVEKGDALLESVKSDEFHALINTAVSVDAMKEELNSILEKAGSFGQ